MLPEHVLSAANSGSVMLPLYSDFNDFAGFTNAALIDS